MQKIPVRRLQSEHTKDAHYAGILKIRRLEDILLGKRLEPDLHRHDFFFVLAVRKGRGIHEIDFVRHRVVSNSIFILRPGQVHQLSLGAGASGYLLEFNADIIDAVIHASTDLLRQTCATNHYPLDAKIFTKLLNVLDHVFEENISRRKGYQQIIGANIFIFLSELLRFNGDHSDQKKETRFQREVFEKFQELMEQHSVDHMEVSQYASMLNLSRYQLNAITKTLFGKTCSTMIIDHMILEAKRHLLGTSSLVNRIAAELGYEDVSYFIRFFKKHTGYSPEAFRQKFRSVGVL